MHQELKKPEILRHRYWINSKQGKAMWGIDEDTEPFVLEQYKEVSTSHNYELSTPTISHFLLCIYYLHCWQNREACSNFLNKNDTHREVHKESRRFCIPKFCLLNNSKWILRTIELLSKSQLATYAQVNQSNLYYL